MSVEELDAQIAALLVDAPGASPLPAQIQTERIAALEERMAAMETALYGALDAFEALAEQRIEAAATDAAMAVQRHLAAATTAHTVVVASPPPEALDEDAKDDGAD
jgi:hypothetical protein